jgi:hypothetical protein
MSRSRHGVGGFEVLLVIVLIIFFIVVAMQACERAQIINEYNKLKIDYIALSNEYKTQVPTIEHIQRLIGVEADGKLGPITQQAWDVKIGEQIGDEVMERYMSDD